LRSGCQQPLVKAADRLRSGEVFAIPAHEYGFTLVQRDNAIDVSRVGPQQKHSAQVVGLPRRRVRA
jgi:hypothetical protein